ncbi:hypothetical protein FHX61_002625 [Cupriavidus alkaliphilus]|uniref:Uncharacterized protein n=1 Tax=Cupriavidus alkaliphilus TaxID=942866 RepID=A0A7W4VAC3_9BURK|nr:hypothetical protein [Cupriavidus alkaliphilus]
MQLAYGAENPRSRPSTWVRFTADPDPAGFVAARMNATLSTEAGSLGGDIGFLDHACGKQPLRQRGIEASCHWVFGNSPQMIAKKSANLEGCITTGMGADNADINPAWPASSRVQKSTFSAEASLIPGHPGPLSIQAASTTSHGSIPRNRSASASSSFVGVPERISGGAPKESRP